MTKRRAARSDGWSSTVAQLTAALLLVIPAALAAGGATVTVHDGRVSAAFDRTPAREAAEAIRHATGLEVVLPPSTWDTAVTLRVEGATVEQLLQRLLDALDLGGFALVYDPGERGRVLAVDRGREGAAPVPTVTAETRPAGAELPPDPGAGRPIRFLMPAAEARSVNLGAPGQTLLVQSRSVSTAETTECDGQPGRYPVQPVLVVSPATTHVASVVVCAADGLPPGATLTPGDLPVPAGADYARQGARVR